MSFLVGLGTSAFMHGVYDRVYEEVQAAGGRELVMINSPSEWVNPVVFSMMYNAGLQLPASFHQLYAGSQDVSVSRVDDRTLELEVMRGWGGNPIEGMVSEDVPGRARAGETNRAREPECAHPLRGGEWHAAARTFLFPHSRSKRQAGVGTAGAARSRTLGSSRARPKRHTATRAGAGSCDALSQGETLVGRPVAGSPH